MPNPILTATGGDVVPRFQVGKLTLVAGVATVSNVRISSASQVFTSMNTPGGTIGSDWKVPDAGLVVGGPGTGSFTCTAISTTGTTVTTDTSVLNYVILD
jgi:hypothetical protein